MNFGNETGLVKAVKQLNCSLNYKSFETGDGNVVCQIISCILNTLTSIPATAANLLVVISIWRTPSLHSPSNILLMGLALSDLSVGLVTQPLFQVTLISKIKGAANLYCSGVLAYNVAAYALCGVSLLILTAIGMDRHIALHFHLRYREIVTVKRVIVCLVFIWLVPITSACSLLWSDFTFIKYFSPVVFCLCFSITGFNFCMIYRIARHHRKQVHSHSWAQARQEDSRKIPKLTKSSWSMFLINFTFVLCFFPYFVMRVVIKATGNNLYKQCFNEVGILLVFTNSVLNPILYCWRFRKIRLAITRTTKMLFNRPHVTPQHESTNAT